VANLSLFSTILVDTFSGSSIIFWRIKVNNELKELSELRQLYKERKK